MVFGKILAGVGLAVGAAGLFASNKGARQQSRAFEQQAVDILALSEEERAFALRQAEIEADLISQQGADEAEVLEFNKNLALENAEWERRRGRVQFEQTQKRWEDHVQGIIATMASSGLVVGTGTSSLVISEQVGEMENDLFLIGLNAKRAASLEERQAGFFSLQKDQTSRSARIRAETRVELGETQADIIETTAQARARAARSGADAASIQGRANLFGGASNLLLAGRKAFG